MEFQSTRPARGATFSDDTSKAERIRISIHAPREGRDIGFLVTNAEKRVFQSTRPARGATQESDRSGKGAEDFNPRAPRGARQLDELSGGRRELFQSTRPARGATPRDPDHIADGGISIHAPREGRDPRCATAAPRAGNFNPRAPRGARQFRRACPNSWYCISIHAPREGRDVILHRKVQIQRPFQSTRPARGATAKVNKFLCTFLQKRQ